MPTRVAAVIPAAGRAVRLGDAIEASKEVTSVAGLPAAAHLLHRLTVSGIHRAVLVIRSGKWDVPQALSEHDETVDLAYVVVEESPSELHSVARGVAFLPDEVVALGYPDILFRPEDAHATLLERQQETGADLVLGLFPTDTPEQVDTVELDEAGRPIRVRIKEPGHGLRHCWAIAVWTPGFSRYLLDTVTAGDTRSWSELSGREPSVGHVVAAALDDGLHAEAVVFPGGGYVDIGTPEGLARARSGMDGVTGGD